MESRVEKAITETRKVKLRLPNGLMARFRKELLSLSQILGNKTKFKPIFMYSFYAILFSIIVVYTTIHSP